MKRILVLLVVIVMGQLTFAQVKAPAETELGKSKNPATAENKKHHKMDKQARKAMMKELNLSADQKAKLKEMNEANKGKKDAIANDPKLSEEQKKEQLKDIRKAEAKNMQGVLTDDQKKKMKELKEKRKSEGKGHHGKKDDKEADGSKETKTESPN